MGKPWSQMTEEEKTRHKARMKANYLANKDQYRESGRLWKNNNREKHLSINKDYRDRNKEELNRRSRERRKVKPKTELTPEQAAARKAYDQQYYQRKKDAIKARTSAYYYANREACYERQKQWAAKNPEIFKSTQRRSAQKYKARNARRAREWRMRNPEKYKEIQDRARRSPAYKARMERTREDRNGKWLKRYHSNPELKAYYKSLARRSRGYFATLDKLRQCGNLCYVCGEHLDEAGMTIDHIIPRSKGGKNEISNFMPTHKSCNSKKYNKLDFAIKRPDLLRIA